MNRDDSEPPTILVADDDDHARQLLVRLLHEAGYRVVEAVDGLEAIKQLAVQEFDLVLTDIWMREVDGIEVLYAARDRRLPPEVILLTGHSTLETAVSGLRLGAVNYLSKPFSANELLASVAHALQQRQASRRRYDALRLIAQEFAAVINQRPLTEAHYPVTLPETPRSASLPEATTLPDPRYLQVGELMLDTFRHAASFQGRALHLTPIEFALLRRLAESPGQVVSSIAIVSCTHGYEVDESEAQVLLRAHIRNLRRKIDPTYLVTMRGVGYMLAEPARVTE